MTRDELIDAGILALMNAERIIIKLEPLTSLEQALFNDVDIIRPQAEAIADAFFAALKEPTTAMYENAHGHYEGEAFLPHGLWQAMLAASPLAPEGGKPCKTQPDL